MRALIALCVLALPAIALGHGKTPESAELPEPKVRMWLVAPSAHGPWLLRIDNEDDQSIRIPADARLLRFEVHTLDARGRWAKRPEKCDGPKAFGMQSEFPAYRELFLEPGHSYLEVFDPRLICFGKQAELIAPGHKVHATLGYAPGARHALEREPFAADGTRRPRVVRPLKRLEAPMVLLSHDPPALFDLPEPPAPDASDEAPAAPALLIGEGARSPSPTADAATQHRADDRPRPPRTEPVDELGARMSLTASRWAESDEARDLSISVEAHNVGERPVFVALRPRQLEFTVAGPDGIRKCPRKTADHKVPRDLFRDLDGGKHVHLFLLIAELCPPGTFVRPGIYVATPVLHADETGAEYGLAAMTGVVTTRDPGQVGGQHVEDMDATVIRLRRGDGRFYKERPQQVKTREIETTPASE